MATRTRRTTLLALGLLAAVAGCNRQEAAKPPERIVPVTTATVARKDLAIVESAVGSPTALDVAIAYDPTHVGTAALYVRLPFPEHVARELRVGQRVMLSGFGDGPPPVQGEIREIRPALNTTTLSREVIVAVKQPGRWHPGGSVRGEVVLGVHRNVLVVPEQAVVLRPAGTVVYVVEGETARERVVKTGTAREGAIEVTQGLSGNETVVVDGAGLLSGGARIKVRESRS